MIGLDTNILVRYLTQDDPGQSRKANAEIEKGLAEGHMFFIADIVLCELVWVLETAYGYDRREIVPVGDDLHIVRRQCRKHARAKDQDACRKNDLPFHFILLAYR